jgi:hypothetical protein
MPGLSTQGIALRDRAICAQLTLVLEEPVHLAIGTIVASAKRSRLHAFHPQGAKRSFRISTINR